MYTVVLSFNSAKLPVEEVGKSKDRINEFGLPKDRELVIDKNNPINISFKNISNVIHVLCGCRPAPTYRKSFLKRIPQIDDIAKTAMYKITNNISYTTKDGKVKYITEFTQGKKSPYNSHASNMFKTISKDGILVKGRLTWSGLYKRYGIYKKDVYDKFISIFENIYGKSIKEIQKEFTFIDFLIELRKDIYDKKELFSFLKDIKCTPIAKFVSGCNDENVVESLHNNKGKNLNALCINTAITKKIAINGEIVFSIDEKEDFSREVLKAIIDGTRHATFFDGGLVSVKEITSYDIDKDAYLVDGFLNVEQ